MTLCLDSMLLGEQEQSKVVLCRKVLVVERDGPAVMSGRSFGALTMARHA